MHKNDRFFAECCPSGPWQTQWDIIVHCRQSRMLKEQQQQQTKRIIHCVFHKRPAQLLKSWIDFALLRADNRLRCTSFKTAYIYDVPSLADCCMCLASIAHSFLWRSTLCSSLFRIMWSYAISTIYWRKGIYFYTFIYTYIFTSIWCIDDWCLLA